MCCTRQMLETSRNVTFFPMIYESVESKSRLVEASGAGNVVRSEMTNSAPLWSQTSTS